MNVMQRHRKPLPVRDDLQLLIPPLADPPAAPGGLHAGPPRLAPGRDLPGTALRGPGMGRQPVARVTPARAGAVRAVRAFPRFDIRPVVEKLRRWPRKVIRSTTQARERSHAHAHAPSRRDHLGWRQHHHQGAGDEGWPDQTRDLSLASHFYYCGRDSQDTRIWGRIRQLIDQGPGTLRPMGRWGVPACSHAVRGVVRDGRS